MAQKDWNEVLGIFSERAPGYIDAFLMSDEVFAPNENQPNPFGEGSENFSAAQLKKPKPGNWIPVYKSEELPAWFHENALMPIRAGKAEFFFYRGEIFLDLEKVDFKAVDTSKIEPIESFVPATLTAGFQRNENAYLNKAVALGYINNFLHNDRLEVLEREICNKKGCRMLYGQFGKIKTTKPFVFKTSKGSKQIREGFQFEIDLVLESEEEIIIFEAKSASRPTKNFSLLQLYYPLIYFQSILKEQKPIRTVFIDITANNNDGEIYRLLEVKFQDNMFDKLEIVRFKVFVSNKK